MSSELSCILSSWVVSSKNRGTIQPALQSVSDDSSVISGSIHLVLDAVDGKMLEEDGVHDLNC